MSASFSVLVEETGELIVLKLSPEDAERAQRDHEFLQQVLSRRNDQGLEEETEDHLPSTHTGNDKSPFIWTTNCINLLLTLYEKNMENFESGSQRHNKIWATISSAMKKQNYNVTWTQCQSKLNGLKKTYKKIHDHHSVSGNDDRKPWPYFDRMNEIFGLSGWGQRTAVATEASPTASTSKCSGEINSNQTNKKRKASIDIKQYLAEMKEKKAAREEKQRHREEMMKAKNAKIDEILKQKKEQHQEKMAMMQQLINAFVAKK